jgi:hypothetical protein
MLARPRIRQLTLGELFDESFRIYRRDLLTLIALTALVIVPYTILNVLITLPLQQNVAALAGPAAVPGAVPPEQFFTNVFSSALYSAALAGFLGFLYGIVFLPLMEGALTHAVTRRYLDQPVSIGDSIGGALRRALPLIVAKLLPSLAIGAVGLLFFGCIIFGFLGTLVGNPFSDTALQSEPSGAAIGLGFLFLFGGSIVFGVLYAFVSVRILFTSQAVIAENKGPIEAIKRSWNLTQDYWWRTFGIFLLIGLLAALITFVPSAIFGAIFGAITLGSGGPPNFVQQQLANSVISAITSVLVTPFSLIAYTLMYYDLRIRKEGFDLEHQARALVPDPNTGYTQPFNM